MAKNPLSDDRCEALCQWLTANGINPNHVPRDADLTIRTTEDGKVSAYEVFDLGLDGSKRLDERGECIAIKRATAPLLVEPPEWWEPHQKPTREALLAAADRVRTLHLRNEHTRECQYCSHRDYPTYSVPYPCDTIRALEEPA